MKLFCFAISNVFDCVVLIAAVSAVHTWIGWLVASWLEGVLNVKGHNHGISQDTWHKKVLILSCVLLGYTYRLPTKPLFLRPICIQIYQQLPFTAQPKNAASLISKLRMRKSHIQN